MFPVSSSILFRHGQEPGIELSTNGSRAGAIRGFTLGTGWPRLSLRHSGEQVYLFVRTTMFLATCSYPRQVCGIAVAQEGCAHKTILGTMVLGGGHVYFAHEQISPKVSQSQSTPGVLV